MSEINAARSLTLDKAEMQRPPSDASPVVISREDLTRLLGEMDDEWATEVLALKPKLAEIEEAVAWMAGNGDILARCEHPLSVIAAAIIEILGADDDEPPRTA